ncbi:MAG: ABC-F family ATP-binding cassette domain-containing protein [Planctomycetota bacterium]
MSLVRMQELVLQFGDVTILDKLNLAINENAKIGLIGDNGTGKSTLLKVLSQKIPHTTGNLIIQPRIRVAYLAQELETTETRTVYEEILSAFDGIKALEPQLRKIEEQLSQEQLSSEERQKLAHHYDEIQETFRIQGGYEIEERVKEVLSRLKLPASSWDQPLRTFSGGEKNLIGIAKILVLKPHIFLFDEPTNHLDAQGIDWFTEFLQNEVPTFILVSHNRYLLDQCVQEIWELKKGKIKTYTGNYSAYRQKKAEDLALQERLYKTQQATIERLEFQARRLKDMASAYNDPGQAKRAKALERRAERMDVVEKPETDQKRIGLRLNSQDRHGVIALDVKDYSIHIGDRTLLDRVHFQIQYQERVCLAGPNGSGKTSLFHAIINEGSWEHPSLRIGKSAHVGYYSQMHDTLNPELSLVENVRNLGGVMLNEAKNLLFRFLFHIDDLDRKVSTLSGGEKSRVQLATIMGQGVNLLLLDEPTNHLDIQSCEIIEKVLEEFEGTLFIISHDRYFLNKIVQRVLSIEPNGKIKDYLLPFQEYWDLQQKSKRSSLLLPRSEGQEKTKKSSTPVISPLKELQKEWRKWNNKSQQLEKEIERLESEIQKTNQMIEEAYNRQNFQEGTQFSIQLKNFQDQLSTCYSEWEKVLKQVEELDSQIATKKSNPN